MRTARLQAFESQEQGFASKVLRALAPPLALIFAIIMAYGFEIFSFNLTLDQDLFGATSNVAYAQTWLEQGRWGMALLTRLIPSPVGPVVSTILGVALTAGSLWILSRRFFNLTPWQSAAAVSLATTLPTLAFMFSFSTIAYGIGIGNVILVLFFVGLVSESWRKHLLGVAALAFAVGIYESFLAAGAALVIFYVLKRPGWVRSAIALASLALSFVLSRLIALAAQFLLGVRQDSYIASFIDLQGLLSDPAGRLKRAVLGVWQVISLSAERFGLHSPWLAVAIATLVTLAAIGGLCSKTFRGQAINIAALVAILLIPVAVEVVSPVPVLLRSMIYLPMLIAVLAGLAAKGLVVFSPRAARMVLGAFGVVIILAVVGQSTISNRLFAASEMSYGRDQKLSYAIGEEKDRLVGVQTGEPVPIYVSGTHRWPESNLVPSRETLGVSFFAGLGGPGALQYRAVAFLRSQGVSVKTSNDAEQISSSAIVQSMPTYPQPGWIAYQGGVLILNFGNDAR